MCEGFGLVLGIDEDLVVPDKSLSLYEECVACWRGPKLGVDQALYTAERGARFPIHRPYHDLTPEEHDRCGMAMRRLASTASIAFLR